MPTHDDRAFHLWPYQCSAGRWRTRVWLLIPAGATLYWTEPQIAPESDRIARLAFSISLFGLLITQIRGDSQGSGHKRDDHRTIRTPVYPVAFSLRRIDLIGRVTNLASDAIIKCTRSKPWVDKIHCDHKTRRVIHRVIHRRNRTSCDGKL